jgi:spermidine/putrescine transport system permease protein
MPAKKAYTSGSRNFWSWLATNGVYQSVSGFLLGTPKRRLFLLAALPILWALVANLGPLIKMLDISFYDAYPLSRGREATYTIAAWREFFETRVFYIPFFRTLGFSAVLTFATLVLVYPVAYFLARHVPKHRQMLFLLIVLIPFWVGEIIRTYAIMILLGNNGAINNALKFLGLIDRPIPFMYTGFSLGIGIVYLVSLYMLLPLYSALEKIPQNMNEAAADLGAGPWRRFWKITLPLSKDGITSGCVLVFLISTGFYATPVILGGPSSTMFAESIANTFNVAADRWPTGAAFSSIMLITTLTLAAVFLKIMGRRGKGFL